MSENRFCKVVEARKHNSLTGKEVWQIVLECGTKRTLPGRRKNPPKRLACNCN